MITQENFDWDCTNKSLCILIPNYGRGSYIRNTLWQFQTNCPKEDYNIVIINDGLHEDFSDLAHLNINYFTFIRPTNHCRNGCFVRNYFIKRAKCKNLFQKDPETVLQRMYEGYDWVLEYSKRENLHMRPGHTLDVNFCPLEIQSVHPNVSHRVHWGCSIPLEWLKQFPYSEAFDLYGYEDTELYFRIRNNFGTWNIDNSLAAIHLGHQVANHIYSDVNQMAKVYNNITYMGTNKDWGNG